MAKKITKKTTAKPKKDVADEELADKKAITKATAAKKPAAKGTAKKSSKKTTVKSTKKTTKKTTKKSTKKTAKKSTKKTAKKSTKKTTKKSTKKTTKKADSPKPDVKQEEQSVKKEQPEKEEKVKTPEELELEKEIEEEKQLRLESFRKAGEIHKQVRTFIQPLVKVGVKYLDIVTKTEEKIIELGGEIGFPCNISVNEVACHYTSPPDDENVIKEGDIVKVDFGVAIEGYTADGAFTVSFSSNPRNENLVLAVETAVMKGLSMIKPGVNAKEVGRETSKIIKGFGYNPIKDLSGHSIEKYQVHGSKSIPNFPAPSGIVFEEGDVFALECFASTGAGNIHSGANCYIYAVDYTAERIPIRMKITRAAIKWISNNKKTLPFSTRSLLKEFRTGKMALKELTERGKLVEHKVLREESGVFISQFEHTFLVTADGIEQLT